MKTTNPENNKIVPVQSVQVYNTQIPQTLCDDIEPTIQFIFQLNDNSSRNVVSTANLKCRLDLKEIALKCRNAEYNPKRFAAVIMRLRNPKTTALVFESGKIVCTGAKSPEFSQIAARKFARIIQKIGFPVEFHDFKVQNIVGSCDVRFPIHLDDIQHKHSKFAIFEPDIFPGLIYRMTEPKIVLLIFVSGKLVLTGAKTQNDINQAFKNIYPLLKICSRNKENLLSKKLENL